jgi:nucleotide-binding universal stress UspA family protein
MREADQRILERVRRGLEPPTREEFDRATAKWLFGSNAEKMMRHAPWSFVLMKLMWKKGEEPWQS